MKIDGRIINLVEDPDTGGRVITATVYEDGEPIGIVTVYEGPSGMFYTGTRLRCFGQELSSQSYDRGLWSGCIDPYDAAVAFAANITESQAKALVLESIRAGKVAA